MVLVLFGIILCIFLLMKQTVDPSVYTKDYYLHECCGYEEFMKNPGNSLPHKTRKLLDYLPIKRETKILDLGCGRGDLVFYLSKKEGAKVVGIDYSDDAIAIAKKVLGKQAAEIKKNAIFKVMSAKKLSFPDNHFDTVVSIDVFEHIYKEELEEVMGEISRVLKRGGTLLIRTEPNKIYLNFIHRLYVYPVSSFLIRLNEFFTKKEYPGLPRDPRHGLHKIQHVNEPTYFYLKKLFRRHHFDGKIISNIALLKSVISWKDVLYNVVVLWYPLCLFFPFYLLFSYDFICVMRNNKIGTK